MRTLIHDQTGIAAVEFALIAPVLLLILVGMVDFGLYIHKNMQTENLARNAAEFVLKGGDPANLMNDVIVPANIMTEAEIEAATIDSGYVCECGDGSEVDCNSECTENGYKRRYFSFNITRTHETAFPYPGIPDQMTLKGHARLQVE